MPTMVIENDDQDELGTGNGAAGVSGGKGRRGKPPFQLCFAAAQEQGRSNLSMPKLPRNACELLILLIRNLRNLSL